VNHVITERPVETAFRRIFCSLRSQNKQAGGFSEDDEVVEATPISKGFGQVLLQPFFFFGA